MSTKIFDAYRFCGDFRQLHERLHGARGELGRRGEQHLLRARCALLQDKAYAPCILELSVDLDVRAAQRGLEQMPELKTLQSQVFDELLDRFKALDDPHHRDPLLDVKAEACVIPHPRREDEFLIKCYAEQCDLLEHLGSLEGFVDYHYQNCTDRPEGVDEAQWVARWETWREVLGGDGWAAPVEVGFSYRYNERCWMTALDLGDAKARARFEAAMPSPREQARSLARRAIEAHAIRRPGKQAAPGDAAQARRQVSMSGVYRVLSETRQALGDPTSALARQYLSLCEALEPMILRTPMAMRGA
ncbi:hypothetical protein [Thioalkalivibrio thiocyanodenitrificans]|uniref:hypothetical protein n=1 Tax=Thioalkalivibrio thiocyanodenitrificans TaxID=243063 RepID=UPI00038176D6|nr:hypothetical protein [Thioalkalivibrio thiocyanodenitrificans]